MIDEGNARLQRSLDEGNARLQRSLEDGNRRLEIILDKNQKRWKQSDEFNKRILDKILDKVA
ncbi:MAG: hypothetical protein IT569_09450 [Leptospiraceae bacterium]|nr:hypothetical protein [Leptospiraceae bacterium]